MSTPQTTRDRRELNNAVRVLAAKDRQAAVEILARYGAMNTATLPPEKWQDVLDACTEALKKFDGARL